MAKFLADEYTFYMKSVLRHYVVNTLSLYTVTQFTSGLVFERGLESLLLTGLGITLVTLLAKPVINLLLLPLNLITFGLFRWVSSAIALYLVTLVVQQFKVTGFVFAGYTSKWFDIPHINLEGITAFVVFSLIISLVSSFVYWLIK